MFDVSATRRFDRTSDADPWTTPYPSSSFLYTSKLIVFTDYAELDTAIAAISAVLSHFSIVGFFLIGPSFAAHCSALHAGAMAFSSAVMLSMLPCRAPYASTHA